MKIIIFFTFFLVLIAFSIHQEAFAYNLDDKEDREKAAKEAADELKRDIPTKESEVKESEEKEEKKVKKKLGKLKKFLPTEKEFDEVTLRTVWRYVDKESEINDDYKFEKIQALIRDVGRVYDPIVNKYKVSTIQIEIINYKDSEKLNEFWITEKKSNLDEMFANSYLIGSLNENTKCFFNYSNEGGMTICKTDEFVVQSVIFDKYQEHYMYSKPQTGIKKLELNQDEMTTRIVENIIKKIQKNKEIENYDSLYKVLESNIEINEREYNKTIQEKEHKKIIEKEVKALEEKKKNELLGIEKDKKYGIQNFACIKDEFGLITISGQYNNNQIKKDKVIMEVQFFDYEGNIIFKNTAKLLNIDEFETKRFLGNLKINENFSTCSLKINN